MSTDDQELEAFGRRAGAQLLRGGQVDAATRSRLAAVRAAALEAAGPRRRPAWLLVPAGALASAALVAVLLTRPPAPLPDDGVNAVAAAALYDLELLADADAWAIGEEADLEFIEWAAGMSELEGPDG
ncbi:MAG TPA: hypothetical protein VNQ32_00065 [Steroidobacteraceae bacterium]|nr:hypothetical protein [Steroidobacteraceae bacterium]